MTAEFQEAFGRLLLDVNAREAFLADPDAYAARFDDSTSSLLRAIDPGDLEFSAENLIDKRRGHAREWMPHVVEKLGARFKPAFREHALRTSIEGADKHRADALGFIESLVADEDRAVAAAAVDAWLALSAGVVLERKKAALTSLSVRPVMLTVRRKGGLAIGWKGRLLRRWRW